jgi:uncharacterized membrane protein YbhN (UPF0104 family)
MIFYKNIYLRFLIGLLILALFLYFGQSYFTKLNLLTEAHLEWTLATALFFLITRYSSAEVLRISLLEIGSQIKRHEGFLLNMVMGYTNLIFPKTGLSAPIIYLKVKHQVAYSQFAALLMPTIIIQLIVASLCGVITTIYAVYIQNAAWNQQWILLCLFGGIAGGNILLVCCHLPINDKKYQGRILRFLSQFNKTWILLSQRFSFMIHIAVLQLAITILRALRMEMAFFAVGAADIPFSAVFAASLCAQFAMLISLTPGALGFREAAIGMVMFQFAENPEIAVAAAFLDRIVMTACMVLIGQVGVMVLIRPILKKVSEK